VSEYDVIVIGSGPGGYVAAIYAAQQGFKTAIVEYEKTERLGGTCLLRGCIPTKAMLQAADLLQDMSHSEDFGIVSGGTPRVDMDKMDAYRARIVAKNAGGVKYLMKKNKIDVLLGHGRLAGDHKVSVTDKNGKVETHGAKFVILATGSAVRHVGFIKMDHERIIDSDDLLQMKDKPEHLVVLGAGAVGSEFASVFLRYGSKVTLVEMQDRILPIEDDEVSAEVEKVFRRTGMKVMTSAKLTKAERTTNGVKLAIEQDGKTVDIDASHLLVAIGRKPVSEDIGIQGTKVKLDERGFIEVNEFMRTGADWVYAIGDVVNTPWLAHVASKEGILAVEHMKGHAAHPINYGHVPNCTYCYPEVGSVGLTEREAKKRGIEVKVGKFPFSAIAKASILGKSDGFIKIIAGAKYDEILGVHIVGPKATELLSEGTLALELEATVAELLHMIHPHPTLSEAMGEAAHGVIGETIHI
jgi:dihydrolipoamide dehydrogenase